MDLSPVLDAAAQEWNLDPALLQSVSQVESGQQANGPDSSAGAMGPLQVMSGTAADMGATNPRDPVQNVYAGAKYLSGLLDKYQSPDLALAAYNAGPGRVDDYLAGKGSLPAETVAYVPKVAAAYAQFGGGQSRSADSDSTPAAPPTPAPYQVASADTGMASDALPNPSAPPSALAAAPPPAPPADPFGQMMQAATRTPPAASAAAAPATGQNASQPATAAPSGAAADGSSPPAADPFSVMMSAASKAGTAQPAPAAQGAAPGLSPAGPPAAATPAPGFWQGLAPTAARVLHDVTDRPAELLAQGADALGITGAVSGVANALGTSAPTGNQLVAQDRTGLANYDSTYDRNPLLAGARVGGDIAATVPLLASGGAVLGAGADLAGAALGSVSPTAGAVLGDTVGYLSGAGGTGNLLTRAGSLAAGGALQGAGAAVVTAGASDAPIGNQLVGGALTGGVLGAAAPVVARAGSRLVSGALGGSISPETAALAQTARDTYGIPLQAGQISDSPFVRFLSDQLGKLPFSGAQTASATQTAAMNQAIASTFGSTADQITPDVMQAARSRLGQTFDNLAGQITVQADPQMLTDLGKIENRANSSLTDDRAAVVGRQIDNVLTKAAQGNGTINGDAYQALVSKGGALDDAMNSGDPGVRNFAGQIRDSIEDAMQRQAPPDLAQQLGEARFQYKNLMTVAPLVKAAQDGNVSPVRLLQAVKSNFADMAFSGAGPLGDLATIAQRFMKPPPDSGTATRNLILGPLGAEGLNTVLHEPLSAGTAALSTLGAAGVGRAIGGYLRSPYATNRLINNGLAGNPGNALVNQLVGNAGAAGSIGFRPSQAGQVNPLVSSQ